MAKRFIDTGLFDDEWFSELSQQSKIFWMYYITKCDHAGFMKYNEKLIKFQTGITNLETVLKDFTNRIVRVTEQLLFSPKFIHYQYPNFPDCNFKAATSARDIMIKNKIDPNSYLTVTELLPNSYGIGKGNGMGNGKGTGNGNTGEKFENPFGENFTAWQGWKDYKREEHREHYRSPKTEQAAANKLFKLARGNPETAIAIIQQSIENRWKGLFELKTQSNGTTKTEYGSPERAAEYERLFAKRYGNR